MSSLQSSTASLPPQTSFPHDSIPASKYEDISEKLAKIVDSISIIGNQGDRVDSPVPNINTECNQDILQDGSIQASPCPSPFPSQVKSHIDDECEAFCRHINSILPMEKYPTLVSHGYLPLSISNFFEHFQDGVIFAFLLNSIRSTIIPISSISIGIKSIQTKRSYKALHSINENIRLVLNAAKSLGSIHLVNIGPEDILSGNKSIILGLIWQLIRVWYLSGVSRSASTAGLNSKESEYEPDLVSAEDILIRWINDNVMDGQPIKNLGPDMADCNAYALILEKFFNHASLSKKISTEPNLANRATMVIEPLSSLLPYVRAEDLSNPRLNLCIVADLFKLIQAQIKANEDAKAKTEISGWEATLQAERALYASQLSQLTDLHAKEAQELNTKLEQTQAFLNEKLNEWEQHNDSVTISLAALATRIDQLIPETGRDTLPLSVLLQNSSSHLELISYCQSQLDRIDTSIKRLLEEKAKLCTTISLNKHVNELMSARVREFSLELTEKKKHPSNRTEKPRSKNRLWSWKTGSTIPTDTEKSN